MRRSQQGFGGGFGAADDDKSDNAMALVPFDTAKEKKKRNELLKLKAKQVVGKEPVRSGKVLFDVDGDSTFVTGVGIPGRAKTKKGPSEVEKYYACEEDALLDRVNNTEKGMQDMMKYLDAVENMMGGDDLAQIRRMLNHTTSAVNHHSKAYANIKEEVLHMNTASAIAMK